MKKMAFLINSLESGGAERVASILVNEWAKKYDCYVILIHNKLFYELNDNVKVIHLHENTNNTPIMKLLRLPFLAYKLGTILTRYNIPLVISFLSRANYINVLANLFIKHKTIISERAMPSKQYEKGWNGIINRFMIKMLYKKATICIANSAGNMNDLKKNFFIENVVNIPNPFNLQKILADSKETPLIDKTKFTFISVGRLDHGKNHQLLIEAIKDIDGQLLIVGEGCLKNKLQTMIEKHHLQNKVFLLGQQSNPFGLLRSADCFLFSSNHEGFPNVLVEALACHLPVISTDCPSGPREILAPNSNQNLILQNHIELSEFGILTPMNNVQTLQEAMQLIMNNHSVRENYKTKSFTRACDFELTKIIAKYEHILFKEKL